MAESFPTLVYYTLLVTHPTPQDPSADSDGFACDVSIWVKLCFNPLKTININMCVHVLLELYNVCKLGLAVYIISCSMKVLKDTVHLTSSVLAYFNHI